MLGEKTKQSAPAEGGIDHAVNHTGRRHKSAKLRHKLHKVRVQSVPRDGAPLRVIRAPRAIRLGSIRKRNEACEHSALGGMRSEVLNTRKSLFHPRCR